MLVNKTSSVNTPKSSVILSINSSFLDSTSQSNTNFLFKALFLNNNVILYHLDQQSLIPETSFVEINGLRTFFGNPTAEFKTNEQAQAISSVISRTFDVLFVSGTGAGKSLAFMLPAYMEDRSMVTVVVVPLVALLSDMTVRCEKHNLVYDVWNGNRL